MANELIKYNTDHGEVTLSPQIIKNYLCANADPSEIMMFMGVCKAHGLDPFVREVYLVKYNASQPASIVTGKEVFTKRAMKNPRFAGMEAGITVVDKDGKLVRRDGSLSLVGERVVGGWAKVYLKDMVVPMFDEVSFAEYAGKKSDGSYTKMWTEKPATMIRKVALVHALREAFPKDFQGLYSQEEMSHIDASKLSEEPVSPPINPIDITPSDPGEDEPAPESTPDFVADGNADAFDQVVSNSDPSKYVIDFGKHKGKTLAQINQSDRGYIEWLSRDGKNQDTRDNCARFILTTGGAGQTKSKAAPKPATSPSNDGFPTDDDIPVPWDEN